MGKPLDYIMNNIVKSKLNLKATWGSQRQMVFDYLEGDFLKPVTHGGKPTVIALMKIENVLVF